MFTHSLEVKTEAQRSERTCPCHCSLLMQGGCTAAKKPGENIQKGWPQGRATVFSLKELRLRRRSELALPS